MLRIIAGGKKHSGCVQEAIQEYEKRMQKPFLYDWVFTKEDQLASKITGLQPHDFLILLDESGAELSSPELSQTLTDQLAKCPNIIFLIGGAFGHFSPAIKSRANLTLSLSKMVFPHQICRLILAEQLYRAQEIAKGHPYHHS
ncbi:MAG: 23S rRNA (pseudouridine(1915)-N(3))-methyltransferase RlmH [Candidatus Nomurabacteria bacterium]|jgi:23S rRNA (pseudouridine1915-N3)-methyltransferase|nr:23S rRNA (pseudouridine(1915)-N(3))-methyltransferase RlmH [Candidatus Nomurabacteria bacterium]